MKKSLTIVTKGIVYLMGSAVITVCTILLPELAREEAIGKVNPPTALPFLVGAWVLSIPIFIALYQTLKLVSLIDENKAFSNQSVKALQTIKYCSMAFGILIVIGATAAIILTRSADPTEDVTPIFMVGFIFTFVSSVVATFFAVLKRILMDAIKIKSENDLTV